MIGKLFQPLLDWLLLTEANKRLARELVLYREYRAAVEEIERLARVEVVSDKARSEWLAHRRARHQMPDNPGEPAGVYQFPLPPPAARPPDDYGMRVRVPAHPRWTPVRKQIPCQNESFPLTKRPAL